jgi:hypothetical protein
MKRHLLSLTVLLGGLALCCCSTTSRNSLTLQQFAGNEKLPTLRAEKVRITARVIARDGDTLTLPVIIARPGRSGTAEVTREFVYPVGYELASTGGTKVKGPNAMLNSLTPTSFKKRPTGLHMTVTPKIRGPFIELSGSFSLSEFAGFARAPGQAISPITDSSGRNLLSENRVDVPEFVTKEFEIYSAGLPNTEQAITYKDLRLVLRAELLDR